MIAGRVPLAVKVLYTAFCAVLIPVYLSAYGPTNFLYFCDIAVLTALAAVWFEIPLLASAPTVGIVAPQLVWQVDFVGSAVGVPLVGMTNYMFDPALSLLTRGLSFFHFWLPFLLLYLVWRLGYDRRALSVWTAMTWLLLPTCFFLLPGPDPTADPNLPININYVWGMSSAEPQAFVHPYVWLGGLMVGLPALLFAPTHLALRRFAPDSDRLRTDP
jgi:hypothetical protein